MADLRGLSVKVPIKLSKRAQRDLYDTCMVYKELAELRGAENAKLRERVDAAHMSRLLTENENEKLRKLLSRALIVAGFKGRQYLDAYLKEEEGTTLWQELKGLGIEAGE